MKPDIYKQLGGAQPGDILLFHRAKGINRIIPAFSKSPYYHVGIFAGAHWVVESRPTGVQKRDLRTPGSGQWFRVIPAPGGKKIGEKALEYATRQIGDGYAVTSVFALVMDHLFGRFGFVVRQKDAYSCGELVAEAFRQAGKDLFPDQASEVVAPWEFAQFLPKKTRKSDAKEDPLTRKSDGGPVK